MCDTKVLMTELIVIGIDPKFTISVVNQLRLCESALLVRTRDLAQREKVVGMLQGFNGELTRVPLES